MQYLRWFKPRAVVATLLVVAPAVWLASPQSAFASTHPTISKTVDADNDGTFNATETVPSDAAYPYTVTYQLTVNGGTGPAPYKDSTGQYHIIASINDSNTSDIGSCQALVGSKLYVNTSETCTYTYMISAPMSSPLVNTVTFYWDSAGKDVANSSATVDFPSPNSTTNCTLPETSNFTPDPNGVPASHLQKNIAMVSGSSGAIGIANSSGTTGSVSSPVSGSAFEACFSDETELYQYLNNSNNKGAPKGGSPGNYDAHTAGLKNLPVGTVVPMAGNPPTNPTGAPIVTTGAGLPYAAVYQVNPDGSLGSLVAGGIPVTVIAQNYTPNVLAWMPGSVTKNPTYGQPAPSPACPTGKGELCAVLKFSTSSLSLTPGTVYAAYLLVRDTDQSGPEANHVWYFTP